MVDSRFINNYPYTDFHEMNLDWIITQTETLTQKVDEIMSDAVLKAIDRYFNSIMPNVVYDETNMVINLNFEPTVLEGTHSYNGLAQSIDITGD